MTFGTSTWEHRLYGWALDALQSDRREEALDTDAEMLDAAYGYCADVTRIHSRTFHMASGLLSTDKRRAARALYTFCRVTDDLVDKAQLSKHDKTLDGWRRWAAMRHPFDYDPVSLAWIDAQVRYGIPEGYVQQLIDGVSRDLTQTRYATFAELTEYCYGVASTVGLMSMHIIGFEGEEALPYAVKLGVALQLTNILRDIAEDYRAGRVYLPQDELAAFGLSEADIAAGRVDDRWRAFMRLQVGRNRRLYDEAWPGIALLHPDGRFAIAAAADLYRAILVDIERNDYDVFNRRAHIGALGKLSRLPAIWQRARRAERMVA